jgi:phosphate starvation-inducible PhoH-like protein
MELIEKKIKFEQADIVSILGPSDKFLQLIENRFNSALFFRGDTLTIKGPDDDVKMIESVFKEMTYVLRKNNELAESDILTILELIGSQKTQSAPTRVKNPRDSIIYWGTREPIRARTSTQVKYWMKVLENDMVFAIGPAGTGKTYLAVAMALAELKKGTVSKIILSRPAVEAGENLGFLPGDLKEKLDPYLRPLLDALFIMVGAEKLKNLMEKNVIEIIPLAYMRGRTLSNSFIILDEAQNATITQMKMFLTRMGEYSKVIVTGDVTQIDLKYKGDSGLINANKLLQKIKGISFVYFNEKDVVRHKLVTDIIKAYEKDNDTPGDE